MSGWAKCPFAELELELILSRWLWERGEKGGASFQKQARVCALCGVMQWARGFFEFFLVIILHVFCVIFLFLCGRYSPLLLSPSSIAGRLEPQANHWYGIGS